MPPASPARRLHPERLTGSGCSGSLGLAPSSVYRVLEDCEVLRSHAEASRVRKGGRQRPEAVGKVQAGLPAELVEQAVTLYLAGDSPRIIGRALGASPTRVYLTLRERGVVRTRSEASRLGTRPGAGGEGTGAGGGAGGGLGRGGRRAVRGRGIGAGDRERARDSKAASVRGAAGAHLERRLKRVADAGRSECAAGGAEEAAGLGALRRGARGGARRAAPGRRTRRSCRRGFGSGAGRSSRTAGMQMGCSSSQASMHVANELNDAAKVRCLVVVHRHVAAVRAVQVPAALDGAGHPFHMSRIHRVISGADA